MPDQPHKTTILLVEDEALIAMQEAMLLDRHGYAVKTVHSAEEAIAAMNTHAIDLILMDIDLGNSRMDGTEAAEAILQNHEVPIVFLTSHTEQEVVRKVKGITRYGYVIKDTGDFVLLESIQMALELFRANRQIEEREQRLKVISEIGSDYAYCHRLNDDGSLEPVWHIGSFTSITGYTPEELFEQGGWASLIHEDDFPVVTRYVERLLAGKNDFCVARVKTKSGDIRWIEDRGRPWFDAETGKVIGAYGSARDITQIKQFEEQLHKQEALYRTLMENSIDAVYLLSEKGRILSVNHVASEMTGYSRDELTQLTIDDIDPNYPSHQFIEFWADKPEGSTVLFESLHKHKNGTIFPVEVNGIFFVQDGTKYLFGVARDLSEKKRQQAELSKIEWMLQPKKSDPDETYLPRYGELSRLNENGLILSLVGKERLMDIASEYLELLETSAAVYEVNGDYALGLFSSGWCRLLDGASRELCGTEDNREALQSGCWLCHESCWRDASAKAITTGAAVDVPCHGGIRLYALPVYANGKVVGSLNFGYGDPPQAESALKQLAVQFKVSVDRLRREAEKYQSRPPFIIDLAKRRLKSSADYLGRLIERAMAEQNLTRVVEEKDFLMRELNHRVKNNLLMISSLIKLKDVSLGPEVDLSDISRQIDAISIVHEKLHNSSDITHINLKDYLNDLLHTVFSFCKEQVAIEMQMEDIKIDTRTSVALGLMVNEIATNAVKYGFPGIQKPVFSITFRDDSSAGEYCILLANNGPPFPKAIDFDNPDTLGLRLISGLVQQLNGTIELRRSPQPEFTIRFPAS